jgi:serine O-acetyltransferase
MNRDGQTDVASYQLRTISIPPKDRRIFPRTVGQGCGRRPKTRSRASAPWRPFSLIRFWTRNSILNRAAFEDAVIHRISARLGNEIVPAYLVNDMFGQAVAGDEMIGAGFRADIVAVLDRDPACECLIEPLLYFKGFHAIQTNRLAHWLWTNGRREFALCLQSRSSDLFQTDIHPAAEFGKGISLDHATGLVVGETSVIDDDVSILQNVRLGGTGNETGDRHPNVRRGVMIGAGAKFSATSKSRRAR